MQLVKAKKRNPKLIKFTKCFCRDPDKCSTEESSFCMLNRNRNYDWTHLRFCSCYSEGIIKEDVIASVQKALSKIFLDKYSVNSRSYLQDGKHVLRFELTLDKNIRR